MASMLLFDVIQLMFRNDELSNEDMDLLAVYASEGKVFVDADPRSSSLGVH